MAHSEKKKSKRNQGEKRPLFFEGFASVEERIEATQRLERYLALLHDWDRKVKGEFGPPSRN